MFGQNVRQFLKAKKITSRELAAGIGVSETYISYILAGKRNPSMQLIGLVSKFLGVSQSELMQEKKPPSAYGLEAMAQKYANVLVALESMDPKLVAELSARIEAAASLFPKKDAPDRSSQGGASFSRKKKPG